MARAIPGRIFPFRRETVEMTRDSETDRRLGIVPLISLCRFAEAISVGMLIPILPIFLAELRTPGFDRFAAWAHDEAPGLARAVPTLVTPTEEGRTALLFFLTGLAMAFSQIIAGRLSDRFDVRKPFILIGMLGGALCSMLFAGTETYLGLLCTRVLQGFCLGLTFPPMMAIIARHSPPGRGGRVLGLYSTIRLVGFALGPLVGGVIAEFGGYQSTFYGSAILLLISIGMVARFVSDPREGPIPQKGTKRVRPSVPLQFRLLGTSTFLMMVGISAIISLFPAYRREFGAEEWELGLCFSAFIGTRAFLQYPLGWFGDRFDKKRILLVALAAYVPIVFMQGFAVSLNQLIVMRAALGVVSAAISVSVGGISAERSQAGNRARVMGINTLSFSLGTAFGPLLTGFIDDRHAAFGIPAVAALIWVGVIAFAVPSDRQHRERRREVQESAASAPEAASPHSTTPA